MPVCQAEAEACPHIKTPAKCNFVHADEVPKAEPATALPQPSSTRRKMRQTGSAMDAVVLPLDAWVLPLGPAPYQAPVQAPMMSPYQDPAMPPAVTPVPAPAMAPAPAVAPTPAMAPALAMAPTSAESPAPAIGTEAAALSPVRYHAHRACMYTSLADNG